ncbi:16S rRNA (guanine(527)-N(7))-methyltransferase RsmG [Mangrovimicrobium sediminis]|uniref:Ribosomal RNA small subunit methyltransferase G n=1 Tax=Mangrovimicrobium sediminis TaxID=2562682 RepID=A0A4Z0LZT8_9GAMM|nr:16S rRNA (guanine(527)-N(7))-methyltransferase RsmG [Haliea sp. SAOS-164]TGD72789.1 16S rRNA (guanine(527)-N(7))-methyltransferase RsmG [Haliea sp. SAOS-164]
MEAACATELARGCETLGVGTSGREQEQLLTYLELLAKWNGAYNLTAVREPLDMVRLHLLDSLAIAPFVHGQRLIDVGTGGGLPGVPLAILFPEREIHLLDSNGKKTRFLFQVKTALGLDNMAVHQARVEQFRDGGQFDAVLSRAFASLRDMVIGCRHLPGPEGVFLAMKGAYPQAELDALGELCDIRAVHPLSVPGLDAQRHLVEMALREPSGN